jgi:glycosyltransferase involved in cell wall biosynthesis
MSVSQQMIPGVEQRRILVDLRGLEPDGINGGLQTYVTWLLPWLVEKHRERFAFIVLARFSNVDLAASLLGEDDAVIVEADSNRALRGRGKGMPTIVVCSMPIIQLIPQLDIKVIYSPLGSLPCIPPTGVSAISLVADMLHMEMPMGLDYPIVRDRARSLDLLKKHATWVQCISHSSESRLLHHMPKLNGRTFFSYLPIHTRFQTDKGSNSRSSRQPFFLYPANFWAHKNHLALIIGYNLYVKQTDAEPWGLVLTGADYRGGMKKAKALVSALGIEDRVIFKGYVSDKEMSDLWSSAGALVFPSLHEGFGIPLLEAMHHEVPILTSPNYSLLEIAGPAALYFNPMKPAQIAERMLEVTGSKDLRDRLCKSGTVRLKQFSDVEEAGLVVSALSGEVPARPPFSVQPHCGCPV